MKAFAAVLLALGVSAPAFAGPYVSTKSEFKGDEDGYSKTVNTARIGHTFDLGLGKSYVEAGGGITSLMMEIMKDSRLLKLEPSLS